jgi:F5/8 type C domain/von Willebrand factor type A domain
MKKVLAAVIGAALVAGGVFVYRSGWIAGRSPTLQPVGSGSPSAPPTATPAGASPTPATAAGTTAPPSSAPAAAESGVGQLPEGNLALLDAGALIEFATSQHDTTTWAAARLIDGGTARAWCSRSAGFPQDIVVSFFARQPALVGSVVVNPGTSEGKDTWARDVEIWTSTDSPTDGFTKVASTTLRDEKVDQTIPFPAVEVRYVKLRILSNNGSKQYVECGRFKVIETRREGYVSLLERHPDLAAWLKRTAVATPAPVGAPPAPPPAEVLSGDGCSVLPPTSEVQPPTKSESRKVLVVGNDPKDYPPTAYRTTDTIGQVDYSIYGRVELVKVGPTEARTVMLLPALGFDTVVFSQLCDIKTSVSDEFKKALVAWVAEGHKLIIQDSDRCGRSNVPDYSFLPFTFATSNPGAMGAGGKSLVFVEENLIGNGKPGKPGYLDLDGWLRGTRGENNELGDSNTIIKYDPHWCGHLFGTNALKKNGFMEAYAHYGRGLIIYNGFDRDQYNGISYRQLVTRELAQPFDPDNLPCSARLADFVIATEERLKNQLMMPGQTFAYPLKLLSNQGYQGTVSLKVTSTPADPTFDILLEPDTVAVSEIASAALTVKTTSASLPGDHRLAVRGTDAAGKTNVLCLNLAERRSGSIQIISGLQRTKKPTRNLEIILDASGSMKLALGKKTRWATALDVLKEVVDKLPDDFKVGLRVYGHREPSTSPKTCTDSQLVLPIAKLDRQAVVAAAGRVKPRGETPLVYSVLQTPSDLKSAGAGTVIVITDGEESCGGDPKAALKKLGELGIDVTLDIVGFTLTDKKVRGQLTAFAEGTGGHYYGAQSGESLARALLIAAVDKFSYAIFNASGRQVATGEAGASPEELPPGDYKVVVSIGEEEVTAGPIKVAVGVNTVLKVVIKGDRFAVER